MMDSGDRDSLAARMLQIDFEQRSQHVIHLALDRSKYVRICLLVWAGPLAISAALLPLQGVSSLFLSDISSSEFIAIAFLAAALVNSVILCALVGNRNSSSLAATAMNYMRSIYVSFLVENGTFIPDESAWKAIPLKEGKTPQFKVSTSRSTDTLLFLIAGVDILYALFGGFLAFGSRPIVTGMLILAVCIVHILVLLGMSPRFRTIEKK